MPNFMRWPILALVLLIACGLLPAALHAQAPAPAAPAASGTAPAPAAATAPAPAAPSASSGVVGGRTTEIVDNPYGLEALWRGGDIISRVTLGILAIMSMGSWYVIFV